MNYAVYFRKAQDGRAPEAAFLAEDYALAGYMDARSPKDLVIQIATTDAKDSELFDHRQIAVGDVLVDENGKGMIFTPLGVWAEVEIFGDEENA